MSVLSSNCATGVFCLGVFFNSKNLYFSDCMWNSTALTLTISKVFQEISYKLL